MARGGITKSTLLILRGAKRAENRVMKFSGTTAKAAHAESSEEEVPKISGKTEDSSAIWVPHPRTGIYYPKGHECVMEDVPEVLLVSLRLTGSEMMMVWDVPTPNLDAPQYSH